MLRARREAHTSPKQSFGLGMMVTGALLIVGLTVGGYATHGSPHLPGQPLAERTEATGYESLAQRIESHLLRDSDDADGSRQRLPASCCSLPTHPSAWNFFRSKAMI